MRNLLLIVVFTFLTGCAVISPLGDLELLHPADAIPYNPKFPVDNTGCTQIYATTYAYARWHYHNLDYLLYPTNDILRCADYSTDPEYRQLFHVWMVASVFSGLFFFTP